jgi:putative PEP-CTERM system TPR-repeat lipoprotein
MKYLFTLLFFIIQTVYFSSSVRAADGHYERALQSFQQQKYETSYIYLKNALQANPKNLPAKLLMGQLLTRNNYYQEAIKEFRQAIEYKIDIHLVLVPLGNVLMFNQQYQDVIDLGKGFKLNDEVNFEWKMLSAAAYNSLGKPEMARAEFNSAIKIFKNNTRAINSLAFLDLNDNKLERAERQADKSLKIAPQDHRTWQLKGKIAEAKGDLTEAIKLYHTALRIEPSDPVAKRSLAYALISDNQLDEAKKIAEDIIQQTPNDPFAMMLSSWVLSKNDQGDLANTIIEDLSNKLTLVTDDTYDKNDSLLFVKGMTEYIQGKFEQARRSLTKYINKNKQDINATAMLAEIYISMGQNDSAMHVLERVEEYITDDLEVSLKLADLYLKNSKDFKAEYWLSNLRKLYPDNIKVILMSSKALTARGKMDKAIKLIEDSNQTYPDNSALLLARGFMYVQNGRYEQAIKVSEVLIKADDRNVDYWNLHAASSLRLNKYIEAQTSIDSVLAISPNHFAGRFNQAMLLKKTNRFTEAKKLLASLVEEQPRHSPSQFQLALVESEENELAPAIERLQTLSILESGNFKVQLLLLDLYLKNQQSDSALMLINKLTREFPLEPEFAIKKAEILIANRDIDNAKLQLTKLYNLWLDNPQKLFRLSSMQQSVNDYAGANDSLLKALSYVPQHLILNLEYARLNLQLREIEIAENVANEMLKQYKKAPNISLLMGDIALAKEDYSKAHDFYMDAINQEKNYQLPLIRLYELARRGTKEPQFLALISQLVEEDPENNWRRKLLADHLMNQNKWQQAKPHYLMLVEKDRIKNSYSVLNNLANIFMDEDLTQAYVYAKRALENASTIPAVLDTHGWVLVKLKRYEDGLVSLRQAHAISSNEPSIRFHIAYTLKQLGRLTEARAEVDEILALYTDFPKLEETITLKESL